LVWQRSFAPIGESTRKLHQHPSCRGRAGFNATLRPYQQSGVDWLQFLREYDFGGILADDMGLGKTVQALAHIHVEKGLGRLDKPVLVIAPTSLIFNWRMEAKAFHA